MRLRHQHAGQAHFGELRPQVARKAGGVGLVAKLAEVRDGGLFGPRRGATLSLSIA